MLRPLLFSALLAPSLAVATHPDVIFRGSLQNSRYQFEHQKKGHVAFLGGSITEMPGYRPMVMQWLQKRFPETSFEFTSAGLSSTTSTSGAFRFQEQVLAQGPVDLLLVEFAVNDDQDGHHTREQCIRSMEGIIRQLRRANPRADIVMTFFLNENSMRSYREGRVPLPVAAHSEVAEHYHISTVNLAHHVTTRIDAGEFDWKKFGGVHPAPFGNRIAADRISELLESQWANAPLASQTAPHILPTTPLDPKHYGQGHFMDPSKIRLGPGWTYGIPDWKSLPGKMRSNFTEKPLLCSTQPGSELTTEFEGTAIGAFVLAGPDAGIVEASIDGEPPIPVSLYHAFSSGLHYPRTVLFSDTLTPGKHTLRLRVSPEIPPGSKGNAFRALYLVVNGTH